MTTNQKLDCSMVCKRWHELMQVVLPWKKISKVAVHGPADATTFAMVKWHRFRRLRRIRIRRVTFDQGVWDMLIESVNTCRQLSFILLHSCNITHYEHRGWKNMRPVYSILLQNCTDADGRCCKRWPGTDVVEKLCRPLSSRAYRFVIKYKRRRRATCTPMTIINNDHANVVGLYESLKSI